MRNFLIAVALFCSHFAYSQPQPYVDSDNIIAEGIRLYNEEEYEKSLIEFSKVHPADSNYTWALYEKALACNQLGKYEEALKAGYEALEIIRTEPLLYNVIGTAYDGLKRSADALAIYEQGLAVFPLNADLLFNRAVVYGLAENWKEAVAKHRAHLEINPSYASTHIHLALRAAREGYPAEALVMLGTALLLSPDGEKSLQMIALMDEIAGLSMEGLNSVPADQRVMREEFKDMNLMVKNKLAMNDKFKVPSDFTYAAVRQFYMILDQLGKKANWGDGFTASFYVPFLKHAIAQYPYEDLALLLVASVNDPKIQGQVKKKMNNLQELHGQLTVKWLSLHDSMTLVRDGKPWPAKKIVNNENWQPLILSDEKTGDSPGGYGEIYTENGALYGRGQFKEGKKEGRWVFFTELGDTLSILNCKDNERSGECIYFHPSRQPKEKGMYEKDLATGEYQYFYNSGRLQATQVFKEGKGFGKGERYFRSGQKEYAYTYEDDKLTGTFTEYYATGQPYIVSEMADDARNGLYRQFYPNGSLYQEENYVKGASEGPCKTLYPNGVISSEGRAKEGNATGDWKFYSYDGKLSYINHFSENGKISLSEEFDQAGRVWKKWHYQGKDQLNKVEVFDTAGKLVYEAKLGKSAAPFIAYNFRLEKEAEGNMSVEGKEGEWKTYKPSGKVVSTETYTHGKKNGPAHEYFHDGKLFRSGFYKDDEPDSTFVEYFRSGRISETGNFLNGQRVGEWIEYNPDGTFLRKSWFNAGTQTGKEYIYDNYGKIAIIQDYDKEGILQKLTWYDSTGTVLDSAKLPNGESSMVVHNYEGKKRIECTYKGGLLDGPYTRYYPNGQVKVQGNYMAGKREGAWTWYHPNGKVSIANHYLNDQLHGSTVEKDIFGNKEFEGSYLLGKRDGTAYSYYSTGEVRAYQEFREGEPHGAWRFYAPTGELKAIRYYDRGQLAGYTYGAEADHKKNYKPVKNGTAKLAAFYPNGQKSVEYDVVDNNLTGKFVHYYPSGKVQYNEEFHDDLLHGKLTDYYENGQIEEESYNEFGITEGRRVTYYPNGKIKSEGNYHNDSRHGVFNYYDSTGALLWSHLYYDDDVIKVLK